MSAAVEAVLVGDGRALRLLRDVSDGAGILRRGVGRGAAVRRLAPWRARRLAELVAAVDAIEVWRVDPQALARWLAGSGWGLAAGDAFDRALARRLVRAHGGLARWDSFAVVAHNFGSCLVLRGRRGARLMLMSGTVIVHGPDLLGGASPPWP